MTDAAMIDVAIVGAGIAGIACARRLQQAGLQPVVFDKGRGIGGRIATRRVEGLQFDHGAQYATATGAAFAAVLDELTAAGTVQPWADGSGEARRVGVPGMSALAGALGRGLDIRQRAEVASIRREDGGWTLRIGEASYRAARVVVTAPAPQAVTLLGADHPLAARLASVRYAPCLTLLAGIDAPPAFANRLDAEDPLAWIAHDGSKPGRPGDTTACWVAQAGPAYSQLHLERDPADLAALMAPLLCERLGAAPGQLRYAAVHRWRYANVVHPLGEPFARDATGTLHVGGDGCLGPGIEAAWTSGTSIAARLLTEG